ncbi:MAG: nucleotidyltransferase family protein [Bacteroides sp.]|nr:nucleotidyltransferase family protein [Bacteroides sp.]
MQAMILAAGLGTRLRPWTLSHPKALVPVGGVPMLERVITRLKEQDFKRIIVNVHHFADQVTDFLAANDFGVEIAVSDEREELLDTGGAILNASSLFSSEPVLIHNVDILSNADLRQLMSKHIESGADSTLLVSHRESSRKLIFDEKYRLRGWHNVKEGIYRPDGFVRQYADKEYAFSGIHVVGSRLIEEMKRSESERKFSIIDFLLSAKDKCNIGGYVQNGLELIDIGKPETLKLADSF